MQWHNLIFSNQSQHRYKRHLLFWLLWWLYIIATLFFTQEVPAVKNASPVFYHHQPGLQQLGYFTYSLLVLIKSFLLVLTHMFFCYTIIFVLLPHFQLKKKYLLLISGILVAATLMIPLGYFLYTMVYPFFDGLFNLNLESDKFIGWRSVESALICAIKVTLIAVALTLLKSWWRKQKEKEQLEREKINAELQLLKAQIHPAFLFNTLNNITTHARVASPTAPEMLIKLSDLLSYMLYECDAPKVGLEKEIGMLKEYIYLEKTRQGERLEMTFQINGDCSNQLISPLLLLPFIDNSFTYCNNELVEQAWVNLDITIENCSLSMKLINGITAEMYADIRKDGQPFANIQKRLQLLYPGRHELKINAEQELLMVQLNLKLEEATQEDQVIETPKTVFNHAGV